jgi:hypothetical protein
LEYLNVLREDPTMAGLALVALMIIILPIGSVIWQRIFGRASADPAKQPAKAAKPTRFGNRTELTLLLAGLLLFLAITGWIIKRFPG